MKALRPATSVYLDLIRLTAVALVFIDHAKRPEFTGGFLDRLGVYGQEAVAGFFVLSGLVIANATLPRRRGWHDYAIARLARLWSVVVPAVVLTVVLDLVGWRLAPSLYADAGLVAWRLDLGSLWQALSPLLFLNGVSGLEASVGSNGPFWSLSYEAWYYAGFGVAVFLRGWLRVAVLVAMAWFVGWPIVSLAPIWLAGVWLWWRLGQEGRGGLRARLLWLGSAVVLVGWMAVKYRSIALAARVGLSEAVAVVLVEKFAVGSLLLVNIWAFDRGFGGLTRIPPLLRSGVGWAVSSAFSVYLFQAPLLFFLAAASQGASRLLRILLLYGGVLSLCFLLSLVTERRKGWVARLLRGRSVLRAAG